MELKTLFLLIFCVADSYGCYHYVCKVGECQMSLMDNFPLVSEYGCSSTLKVYNYKSTPDCEIHGMIGTEDGIYEGCESEQNLRYCSISCSSSLCNKPMEDFNNLENTFGSYLLSENNGQSGVWENSVRDCFKALKNRLEKAYIASISTRLTSMPTTTSTMINPTTTEPSPFNSNGLYRCFNYSCIVSQCSIEPFFKTSVHGCVSVLAPSFHQGVSSFNISGGIFDNDGNGKLCSFYEEEKAHACYIRCWEDLCNKPMEHLKNLTIEMGKHIHTFGGSVWGQSEKDLRLWFNNSKESLGRAYNEFNSTSTTTIISPTTNTTPITNWTGSLTSVSTAGVLLNPEVTAAPKISRTTEKSTVTAPTKELLDSTVSGTTEHSIAATSDSESSLLWVYIVCAIFAILLIVGVIVGVIWFRKCTKKDKKDVKEPLKQPQYNRKGPSELKKHDENPDLLPDEVFKKKGPIKILRNLKGPIVHELDGVKSHSLKKPVEIDFDMMEVHKIGTGVEQYTGEETTLSYGPTPKTDTIYAASSISTTVSQKPSIRKEKKLSKETTATAKEKEPKEVEKKK